MVKLRHSPAVEAVRGQRWQSDYGMSSVMSAVYRSGIPIEMRDTGLRHISEWYKTPSYLRLSCLRGPEFRLSCLRTPECRRVCAVRSRIPIVVFATDHEFRLWANSDCHVCAAGCEFRLWTNCDCNVCATNLHMIPMNAPRVINSNPHRAMKRSWSFILNWFELNHNLTPDLPPEIPREPRIRPLSGPLSGGSNQYIFARSQKSQYRSYRIYVEKKSDKMITYPVYAYSMLLLFFCRELFSSEIF